MEDNNEDPGDKGDKEKWDFKENYPYIVYISNYPYKVNKENNAFILHFIRLNINNLVENLRMKIETKEFNDILRKVYNYFSKPGYRRGKKPNPFSFEHLKNGIYLFIDIHGEINRNNCPKIFKNRQYNYGTSSKYLLSEIKKCSFSGLNKPKCRYICNQQSGSALNSVKIGSDGFIRATYRDIFLDLSGDFKDTYELILHELAHTMANHVTFREDDHNGDFEQCQYILELIAKEINFLQ